MTDGGQFDGFYACEYRRLVGALRLLTGDPEVARDAVDEACARAWEYLQRGHEIDVLPAWIRVVAMNVARGGLRRRAAELRARASLVAWAATSETVTVDDLDTMLDVQNALARLPRRQREVVVLFYFFDQSIESIARELRVPAGTVKTHLHRARKLLAASLAARRDSNSEGSS